MMALTPQEAAQLTEADQLAITSLEQHIDSALRNEFDGVREVVVYLGAPGRRVIATLKQKYGYAGWIVEHQEPQDQRDEHKFILSARPLQEE